jgi:hypothetical protein
MTNPTSNRRIPSTDGVLRGAAVGWIVGLSLGGCVVRLRQDVCGVEAEAGHEATNHSSSRRRHRVEASKAVLRGLVEKASRSRAAAVPLIHRSKQRWTKN